MPLNKRGYLCSFKVSPQIADSRHQQGYPLSLLLFNTVPEMLANAIQPEKSIKRKKNQQRRCNTVSIYQYRNLYRGVCVCVYRHICLWFAS